MLSQRVPERNFDFKLEVLDEERILYHPGEPRAIYLNQTASMVLELCDSARSVDEIISLLQDVFPESEDIRQDVENTLAELIDYGAVKVPPG